MGKCISALGGDEIPNLGQSAVHLITETGKNAVVKCQGAEVRKPLLAVADVNDRGNMVVFDKGAPSILPGSLPEVRQIRQIIASIKSKIPLHRKNNVFVMKTYKNLRNPRPWRWILSLLVHRQGK